MHRGVVSPRGGSRLAHRALEHWLEAHVESPEREAGSPQADGGQRRLRLRGCRRAAMEQRHPQSAGDLPAYCPEPMQALPWHSAHLDPEPHPNRVQESLQPGKIQTEGPRVSPAGSSWAQTAPIATGKIQRKVLPAPPSVGFLSCQPESLAPRFDTEG